MERKLNQDEFDQFLKQSADELRLRPSAAVWENIHKELVRKKRRFAGLLSLGIIFVCGGLATWYQVSQPQANTTPAQTQVAFPNTNRLSVPTPFSAAAATGALANKNTPGQKDNSIFLKKRTLPAASSPVPQQQPQPGSYNLIALSGLAAAEAQNTAPENLLTPYRPAAPALLQTAQAGSPEAALAASQPLQPTATNAAPGAADKAVAAVAARKKSRLSWTLFVTPTISYRKLSENKAFERPFLTPGTPPIVSALYNINNAVMHKPDLGLEFGTSLHYALSSNLKLRTGFQFNISRYDIRAFSYVPEVATIALSNGFGVDSVRAVTNYRNFNGGRSNWLQNFYFQASLPVGMELKLAGNRRVQWSVASAIQPTYVIGNRSYMITADYKNYARVPWLTRRWNMNTNVETFVTVRSGKTEWHVGPQVRYQVLSSFVRKYPVKENLFDFGMKVGVTLK